jgi:hypothetical protein
MTVKVAAVVGVVEVVEIASLADALLVAVAGQVAAVDPVQVTGMVAILTTTRVARPCFIN